MNLKMIMEVSTWVRVRSQTVGIVVGFHVFNGCSVVFVGSIVVVVGRYSGQSFSIQAPPNFQPFGVIMSSMVPSES